MSFFKYLFYILSALIMTVAVVAALMFGCHLLIDLAMRPAHASPTINIDRDKYTVKIEDNKAKLTAGGVCLKKQPHNISFAIPDDALWGVFYSIDLTTMSQGFTSVFMTTRNESVKKLFPSEDETALVRKSTKTEIGNSRFPLSFTHAGDYTIIVLWSDSFFTIAQAYDVVAELTAEKSGWVIPGFEHHASDGTANYQTMTAASPTSSCTTWFVNDFQEHPVGGPIYVGTLEVSVK